MRAGVLIADEPTDGRDITTQAVIMDMIAERGRSQQWRPLRITHDPVVASANISTRYAVCQAAIGRDGADPAAVSQRRPSLLRRN